MRADLHTHTTASDGALTPAELVALAEKSGVEMLAITDHDTVAGVAAAESLDSGIELIAGVELSSNWRNIEVHIVGLDINCAAPELQAGIARQQQARLERAERIAKRLQRKGLSIDVADARRIAGEAVIGRPHFAAHLVASGQVSDMQTAFGKYLGRGKTGDVRTEWAEPEEIIRWITAAGGIAVLAHPAKYKLTNLKLRALAGEFKAAGGQALEVIAGLQDAGLTDRLARLAGRHGLHGSMGSDFHAPGAYRPGPGETAALPNACRPVWELWRNSKQGYPLAGHVAG